MSAGSTAGLPLAGIRVIELSSHWAGCWCGRLFAGLGADVIKVEAPERGDRSRLFGPFFDPERPTETGVPHLFFNMGKRSAALDLRDPRDAAVIRGLIASADVVVESLRPSEAEAYGLTSEAVRTLAPGAVHVSITPYGRTGPRAEYRGSELTEYAASGLMHITGEPGREPLAVGVPMAELAAGQAAFAACVAGLLARDTAGRGTWIDLAIIDAGVSLLEFQVQFYLGGGYLAQRIGHFNDKGHPWGIYPCRDGFVAIVSGPAQSWPTFCARIGLPDLARGKFASMQGRQDNRDVFDALLLPWLVQHDRQEIAEIARASGIAFGYVRNADEVARCPQLSSLQFFEPVHHPDAGTLTYPGFPFLMSGAQWRRSCAPRLGEHTHEVRRELDARASAPSAATAKAPSQDGAASPAGRVRRALVGFRVLDLTRAWAGPSGAAFLADLGAEVIKVEPPEGDPIRGRAQATEEEGGDGPQRDSASSHNRSAIFNQINRSKLGIALDLSSSEGRALFLELVAVSDAVLENYRPGVMQSLGLGYEDLAKVNPRIVLASISGYGQTGLYSEFRGYGVAVEPLSGLFSVTGYPGGEPQRSGVDHPDPQAGLSAASGLLVGLRVARRTGRGQHVETSLLQAMAACFGPKLLEQAATGRVPGRSGNDLEPPAVQGAYPCRGEDEWVAASVLTDDEWQGLVSVLGREDWLHDSRFRSVSDRYENRDVIHAAIRERVASLAKHAAAALLQQAGVPAAAVASVVDLLEDEQLRARHVWRTVTQCEAGEAVIIGPRLKADGADLPAGPAPCFGQHNEAILCGILGHSAADLARWVRDGVVVAEPVAGTLSTPLAAPRPRTRSASGQEARSG